MLTFDHFGMGVLSVYALQMTDKCVT